MTLTYRDKGTSGTQLDIISGNAVIGFVWKGVLSVTAGQTVRWHWRFHAGPARGPQQHGTAATIDEAKAKIETNWRAWLKAAGLHD